MAGLCYFMCWYVMHYRIFPSQLRIILLPTHFPPAGGSSSRSAEIGVEIRLDMSMPECSGWEKVPRPAISFRHCRQRPAHSINLLRRRRRRRRCRRHRHDALKSYPTLGTATSPAPAQRPLLFDQHRGCPEEGARHAGKRPSDR